MLTNAFIGKKVTPTDADLAMALGPAKKSWDQLLSGLAREHGVSTHEWKCYSPKMGWTLRATLRKRTIVWLGPSAGRFEVMFILGARAMQAARQVKLPLRVVRAMDDAHKYPEGTGVRLAVKSPAVISGLLKLAAIKVAN